MSHPRGSVMEVSAVVTHARNDARRLRPAGVDAGAPLTWIRDTKDALGLVAEEMVAAELRLRDHIVSDVSEVPKIAGYLVEAGGKRLRPALTALSARTVGLEGARVHDLMCVGEMIHLGSLLHDDVVDDADRRRGRPSAHVVHSNAATILTGDFCLARSVFLASEAGGHAAVTGLARAVTEMAEGEVLQLKRAGNLDTNLDQYLEVIDRKSAALIGWCAAAGALAIDDGEAAAALEEYGRQVGVAFQITDDVLDYAPATGKRPGADLRERKVTLPLLLALDRIPGLRAELEAAPPEGERLESMMARIREAGALEDSLAEARRRVQRGIDALAVLPHNPGREALQVLAHFLVERVA